MARTRTGWPRRNGRPVLDEAEQQRQVKDLSRSDHDRQTAVRTGQRRVLYEAAHKLKTFEEPPEHEKPAPRVFETERDVVAHAGRAALVLGALGVVYGDIGTSPLYTEQVIFSSYHAAAHITPAGVYGVASLIFWALMIVVSIKYAGFIMRAHNRGDGGIMALAALMQRQQVATRGAARPARHLRRRPVLRRRHHHAGDLGPRRRGAERRHAGARPPRRAALARDPDRAVRAPAFRLGHGRLAVRPGDPGVVCAIGVLGPQRGGAAPGGLPGALADLGGAVHHRPRRGRLPRRSAASCWRSPARRRCTPTAATSAPSRSGRRGSGSPCRPDAAQLPRPGRR